LLIYLPQLIEQVFGLLPGGDSLLSQLLLQQYRAKIEESEYSFSESDEEFQQDLKRVQTMLKKYPGSELAQL